MRGPDLDERIDGILVPQDGDSMLCDVVENQKPVRGVPPQSGLDARLLRAMGRSDSRELLIIPIVIRGRVVNLLYIDNGRSTVGITQISALRALGLLIASAYERIILERKSGVAVASS